jgi:hypothetical protein
MHDEYQADAFRNNEDVQARTAERERGICFAMLWSFGEIAVFDTRNTQ